MLKLVLLVTFLIQVCRVSVQGHRIVTSRPIVWNTPDWRQSKPEGPVDIEEVIRDCDHCRYTDHYMNMTAIKDKHLYACFVNDFDPQWLLYPADKQDAINTKPCDTINNDADYTKLRKKTGTIIAEMCRRHFIFWMAAHGEPPLRGAVVPEQSVPVCRYNQPPPEGGNNLPLPAPVSQKFDDNGAMTTKRPANNVNEQPAVGNMNSLYPQDKPDPIVASTFPAPVGGVTDEDGLLIPPLMMPNGNGNVAPPVDNSWNPVQAQVLPAVRNSHGTGNAATNNDARPPEPYPVPTMGSKNTPGFPMAAFFARDSINVAETERKEETKTIAPPTPDMRTPSLPKGLLNKT